MNLNKFTPRDLYPQEGHNITENLPEFLKQACNQFNDTNEKELFLFSALGVLSGCLPNYYAHYDGKWYSPHLYVFVLAPFGTGKGSMVFAKLLGDSIHKTKKFRYKEAMIMYRQELKKANRKKCGAPDESDKTLLPLPANEMLFFPADCSKTALIDTMNDNIGSGIIFETEGDTLTSALKQDYASYMDILLKAYHHEPISFLRRQDREHKEVLEPRLAIILSSTFQQFLTLIRSAENGLVSRFAFYLLPENKAFRDVFSDEKKNYREYFINLGKSIELTYDNLSNLPKPIFFNFTTNQQVAFNAHFTEAKFDSEGLGGSVNRLALMCYRIAMILGLFRHYENHENHPVNILCEDRDFTNALEIVNILHENAETIHILLPKKGKVKLPADMEALFNGLPNEFIKKEAVKLAMTLGIGERRTERFLKNDDRFENVSHGKYKKK